MSLTRSKKIDYPRLKQATTACLLNMPKAILCIFVSLIFLTSPAYGNGLEGCEEHIKYGAPSLEPVLLCRTGYALSHDADHKVPDWVAYHLTRKKMKGTFPRSNFRPDPDLEIGQRAELKDYKGSGYDRGHMAPAAAMKWDAKAMSESFLLSNMAAQVGPGFNRSIWRVLEGKVRKWVVERGELYIVTGPIYVSGSLKTIGVNKVSVPSHFYKVIFDPVRVEAICFVLPNQKLKSSDLPKFIVSVDQVETLTDLDFLSKIEDGIEQLIESAVPDKLW
jgi:endonuclease G